MPPFDNEQNGAYETRHAAASRQAARLALWALSFVPFSIPSPSSSLLPPLAPMRDHPEDLRQRPSDAMASHPRTSREKTECPGRWVVFRVGTRQPRPLPCFLILGAAPLREQPQSPDRTRPTALAVLCLLRLPLRARATETEPVLPKIEFNKVNNLHGSLAAEDTKEPARSGVGAILLVYHVRSF